MILPFFERVYVFPKVFELSDLPGVSSLVIGYSEDFILENLVDIDELLHR
jgi:hypothetical protein